MKTRPAVKKATPILVVERIEPCLLFWERLGFSKTVEVPHGDRLGFVILAHEGLEVMLQTKESLAADAAGLGTLPVASSLLYLEVAHLDVVEADLSDAEVVVPRRKTFYGADEIFLREPGGNVIGFSQPAPR